MRPLISTSTGPGWPHRWFALLALVLVAPMTLAAQAPLADLSLEELMNIEVRLVSRRPASIARSPAAVYVLTAEDLRRSGATNLPDALRLVPGMHVAQMDASKWGLTARGFNDIFANKLLVLIDGRSVYNPLFSGVLWEAQDLVFAEADRIEIVRGPGASMWGANAVNGVINIVTRPADAEPGGRVDLGIGHGAERGSATVRYAGQRGSGSYRVFARGFQRQALQTESGDVATDDWHNLRVGLRADWQPESGHEWMLETQAYRGEVGQTLVLRTSIEGDPEAIEDVAPISGGHVLLRWRHARGDSAEVSVQAYYDRARRRDEPLYSLINTADLDVQQRFSVAGRHDLVWGFGYRLIWDDYDGSFAFELDPPQRTLSLYSLFAQDDIHLRDDALVLSVGVRLERNEYTGLEWQPNARLLWEPRPSQTLWVSVSRAVRTPNRVDVDERYLADIVEYEGLPPAAVYVVGNPDFASETLVGVDLGYRLQASERWNLDAAAYHYWYDDLRTSEPQLPQVHPDLPGYLLVPIVASNLQGGVSYGFELSADLQAGRRWRLRGAYSYGRMNLPLEEGSLDAVAASFEDENPHHLLYVRSSWDLRPNVEYDLVARCVSSAPALDVDAYAELDARLAWRPSPAYELSVSGRNLLSRRRLEYTRQNAFLAPSRVGRSFLLQLSAGF